MKRSQRCRAGQRDHHCRQAHEQVSKQLSPVVETRLVCDGGQGQRNCAIANFCQRVQILGVAPLGGLASQLRPWPTHYPYGTVDRGVLQKLYGARWRMSDERVHTVSHVDHRAIDSGLKSWHAIQHVMQPSARRWWQPLASRIGRCICSCTAAAQPATFATRPFDVKLTTIAFNILQSQPIGQPAAEYRAYQCSAMLAN